MINIKKKKSLHDIKMEIEAELDEIHLPKKTVKGFIQNCDTNSIGTRKDKSVALILTPYSKGCLVFESVTKNHDKSSLDYLNTWASINGNFGEIDLRFINLINEFHISYSLKDFLRDFAPKLQIPSGRLISKNKKRKVLGQNKSEVTKNLEEDGEYLHGDIDGE